MFKPTKCDKDHAHIILQALGVGTAKVEYVADQIAKARLQGKLTAANTLLSVFKDRIGKDGDRNMFFDNRIRDYIKQLKGKA